MAVAGRVMDPVQAGETLFAAERGVGAVDLVSGVHLAVGLVRVQPGQRARLSADLSGREEVWYVVAGNGRYRVTGGVEEAVDVAGRTWMADETAEPSDDASPDAAASAGEPLVPGSVAVTRGGEAAEAVCTGEAPLVLLAVRAPLPSHGPKVETTAPARPVGARDAKEPVDPGDSVDPAHAGDPNRANREGSAADERNARARNGGWSDGVDPSV
jgi:hypothetical protein